MKRLLINRIMNNLEGCQLIYDEDDDKVILIHPDQCVYSGLEFILKYFNYLI